MIPATWPRRNAKFGSAGFTLSRLEGYQLPMRLAKTYQAVATTGIRAGRLKRPEMKCKSSAMMGTWSANPK